MPRIDPDKLRAARERRLWTQAELAARIGSAESTLVNIERGKHQPRISTVRKLAEALEVDPAELVD